MQPLTKDTEVAASMAKTSDTLRVRFQQPSFADKPTIIYGLVDPRNSELRYVGKTVKSLEQRLSNHLTSARNGKLQYVARWVLGILLDGCLPFAVILEIIPPGADWAHGERSWIGFFRSLGVDLVNQTDGGEGCGGFTHGSQFKEFVAARNSDPDFIALSQAGLAKSRARNPNWAEQVRSSNLKTWASPELRLAHGSHMKRLALESGLGEKIRAHRKAYWLDPEKHALQSKTIAALCQNKEHIAKISTGAARWMAERRAIFDRCMALVTSRPDLIQRPLPNEPTHHSVTFWRETESSLLRTLGSFTA